MCTRLVDVDTSQHFVLGATRPVLGVTLGAERLDGRRPAALANDRLPGVRGCLGDSGRDASSAGVPKVYRVTQGLKAENSYLTDTYGGQGQTDSRSESGQRRCPQGEDRPTPIRINRTADTGIFRRCV